MRRSESHKLACVAYEMRAGEPPFIATNPQAVMAKHVTDTAPPITTTRPNVSAALAKSLAGALSKAPADRFDSAGAFAAALEGMGDALAGRTRQARGVAAPTRARRALWPVATAALGVVALLGWFRPVATALELPPT